MQETDSDKSCSLSVGKGPPPTEMDVCHPTLFREESDRTRGRAYSVRPPWENSLGSGRPKNLLNGHSPMKNHSTKPTKDNTHGNCGLSATTIRAGGLPPTHFHQALSI